MLCVYMYTIRYTASNTYTCLCVYIYTGVAVSVLFAIIATTLMLKYRRPSTPTTPRVTPQIPGLQLSSRSNKSIYNSKKVT